MQRYYILLKATGESGLPAWLPYRLTATSAELAVEKAKKDGRRSLPRVQDVLGSGDRK